ncbi:MAG: hypothetical protein HY561_08980, partial [Gemmatimonadetes bacterium]|nr:hypothetical protein [Gemmatimonadota bacterium]
RIRTSLDRRFQQAAEEELSRQLRAIEAGAFGRFHGPRYRRELEAGAEITDYLQGSVLVLDASTGDVLALVGGRDFRHSQFDRATQAWRQAGSAFKPFVYAAALEDGVAPSQHIADAPLRFELEGGEVWEPQNFSGEFEGSVTVRQALVRSKNVPTIRLAAEVGTDDVARVARRAGVRSRLPRVPSLAIGTAAVTPLELTSAYTAFASLGETVRPRLVQRIEDAQGRVVWEAGDPERRRVLEPAVAYLLTDMLREAVDHGTATAMRRAGFRGPAAGKTGTTNEGTDVWYVGYTPELVASVWIGFDRPRPILERATGGRLAAPVWGRLMRRIYQGRERPKPWQAPEDIIELRVDPRTGYVLREGCRPEAGAAVQELFVRGMEPAARCPRGGPGTEQRGLFERAFAWLGRLWGRVERWAAAHFGREEAVAPRRRSRYLGAPRLPRADEVPEPQVQVEPPDLEPIIIIPDVEPLVPETSTVEEPLQEPDTTPSPPAPAPGDTILILTPTDSGIVLERAVGRHRRP